MSVKLKLTLIYSAVMVVILATTGWVSWALLFSGLFHNLDDSIMADYERVKTSIKLHHGDDIAAVLVDLEDSIPSSLFIYDTESGTLTGNQSLNDQVQSTLMSTGPVTFLHFKESTSGQLRMVIGPYDTSNPVKLLVVARDAGYIISTLDQYQNVLYTTIPFALIIAAGTGFFLTHSSFRQVRAITDTAQKIDPARLEDRIPVKHKDELGKLSGTLNALFDRIHGFIDRQYRFTANASHDLTSPLTGIRSSAEVALMRKRTPEEYRQSLENIIGRTYKMQSIVDDLMTLASLDAGPRPLKSATINLSALLADVVDMWHTPAAAKGIKLTPDIQPGVAIYGEPEQFERMFDNLLSNAVKYTPDGGTVDVSLKADGTEIVLTVTDNGIGIAPNHLPEIFERFYRIDRSLDGTGLGLSIVRGTAAIYHGRVEAESMLGKGTTFKVLLPLNHS